jgi:hypothetical protein
MVSQVPAVRGQSTAWSGTPGVPGDWFTPSNWTNGVPDLGTTTRINNGGIVDVAGAPAAARALLMGLDGGTGSLCVVDTDLHLDISGFIGWGRSGLQSQGSITASNALLNGGFSVGLVSGSGIGIGTFEMIDSDLITGGISAGNTSVIGTGGLVGSAAGSFIFSDPAGTISKEGPSNFDIDAGSVSITGPDATGSSTGVISITASQIDGVHAVRAGVAIANASADLAESTADIYIDAASVTFGGSNPNLNLGLAFSASENATTRVESAHMTVNNATITGVNILSVGLASAGGSNANAYAAGLLNLDTCSLEAIDGNVGVLENGTGLDPMTGASGRILAADSALKFSDTVNVGTHTEFSSGIGTPSGTVSLTRSTMIVSNELIVGSSGTLVFEVGGTSPGTEHGAVEAGTALLEGHVDVQFSYTPAPGDFFDLVVTGSPTGMMNQTPSFSFIGGGVPELGGGIGLNSSSNQVFRVGLLPRPEIVDYALSNDLICITISNLLAENSYRVERASNASSNQWIELNAFIASGSETTWYGSVTGSVEQAAIRISTP